MPERYLAETEPDQFAVDELGAQINDHEIQIMKLTERIEALEAEVNRSRRRPVTAARNQEK
jgi:hypothetical protein